MSDSFWAILALFLVVALLVQGMRPRYRPDQCPRCGRRRLPGRAYCRTCVYYRSQR